MIVVLEKMIQNEAWLRTGEKQQPIFNPDGLGSDDSVSVYNMTSDVYA